MLHCPVITSAMAAHIVGGHPQHNKPAGVCGTFSFKGNAKDLYFIWTVPGGLMGAWLRSIVLGTATITFHPTIAINHNGVIHYQVWTHIMLGAVPHHDMFRVEHMGQVIPSFNHSTYHLIFGPSYTIFIANQGWEAWRPQCQMWRQALAGNVRDHNYHIL